MQLRDIVSTNVHLALVVPPLSSNPGFASVHKDQNMNFGSLTKIISEKLSMRHALSSITYTP